MRRTLTPRRTGAALVLSLALALSACGSDDGTNAKGTADPAAGVEADAGDDLTVDEFTALVAGTMERGGTATITNTATGLMSTSGEGVIDFTGEKPKLRMTMDMGQMKTETIMVDGAVYLRMEEGGKFMKVEDLGAAGSAEDFDASSLFEEYKDGITDLTYVGEDETDGDRTYHYRATIDMEKLISEGSTKAPEAAEGAPSEVAYDVWLDDDELVRKVVVDMGEKFGKSTITYSNWGEDVDIEAPPADQVMETPSLPSSPEES